MNASDPSCTEPMARLNAFLGNPGYLNTRYRPVVQKSDPGCPLPRPLIRPQARGYSPGVPHVIHNSVETFILLVPTRPARRGLPKSPRLDFRLNGVPHAPLRR